MPLKIIGNKVHYVSYPGAKPENGIIKSIHPTMIDHVFVVYHCRMNDWDNYQNYTGALININQLKEGWFEETSHILSNCCDAPIVFNLCTECGNHCISIDEKDEDNNITIKMCNWKKHLDNETYNKIQ